MKTIKIETEYIKLDQFLKWAEITTTGAEAKMLVLEGKVKVNNEEERRRGKKLRSGDVVEFDHHAYCIE